MTELSFWTIKDIARMLKLDPMTVYRYVKAGKLKGYKFGKEFRINNADFQTFLESARVNAEKSNQKHKSCLTSAHKRAKKTVSPKRSKKTAKK